MKRKLYEWECPQCEKKGNKFKITASKIKDLNDLVKAHNNKWHKLNKDKE